MLKHLRVIFLQDSVLLIQRYPNHRLWKHPLFSTSEYAGFRMELTAAVSTVTKPELHTLDTVVPQVAAILKENFDTLNGKLMHWLLELTQSKIFQNSDWLFDMKTLMLLFSGEIKQGCTNCGGIVEGQKPTNLWEQNDIKAPLKLDFTSAGNDIMM
ncbi:Short-chain dehydrogenase [Phytophthora palmivora]|uniref:Short-chain dehydrogenase n=1 Tax=Phytophthora palmivora TaxID=4796 RepID=A0A2P4WZZ8_9STRA|nr:Short-chain dehydrogenase [Phytophthora palmivora]